ncbi:MAG: hypothetical protein KC476_01705 [Cyanobacteria bacterium HKST-UBA06]|nr:hypothetical protein [Cyanobacteria bacterium HKST-UBA04]MCA9806646.1 hypothetical protein [Cyanobacteria bacterium HKST-UBA06]
MNRANAIMAALGTYAHPEDEDQWVPLPKPSSSEMLLPAPALPLLVLLVIIMPLCLLTGKSLFLPFLEWVMSILMPVKVDINYAPFSVVLLIKIGLYLVFSFLGVVLLVLKLSYIYHETWAAHYERPPLAPESMHPPYHPTPRASMRALFQWNIFRFATMTGPPIGFALLLFAIFLAGYWVFDFLSGFFPTFVVLSVGIFAFLVVGMYFVWRAFKGVWQVLTTLMGDVIATTEPEQPCEVMADRARELSTLAPSGMFLMAAYAVYLTVLIWAVLALFENWAVSDVLRFSPLLFEIYAATIFFVIAGVMLNYLKFAAYHEALGRFYRNNLKQ